MKFNFGAEQIRVLNGAQVEPISTLNDQGFEYIKEYTVSLTEVITGIRLIPSQTGYLDLIIRRGTSTEPQEIIYEKTMKIEASDVNQIVEFDACFCLTKNDVITLYMRNVAPIGDMSGMYLAIRYLPAELLELGSGSGDGIFTVDDTKNVANADYKPDFNGNEIDLGGTNLVAGQDPFVYKTDGFNRLFIMQDVGQNSKPYKIVFGADSNITHHDNHSQVMGFNWKLRNW